MFLFKCLFRTMGFLYSGRACVQNDDAVTLMILSDQSLVVLGTKYHSQLLADGKTKKATRVKST